MNKLKITIITATFNSSNTIRDTLQCIADQTHPNIEHIIIDGASTDDTLKIVSQFPHVKKVISEPDKGIYDAMNKGIAIATGDVVGTLGSDDFLPNETVLSKVAEAFNTYSVDSIYGDKVYVNEDKTKIVRYWRPGKYDKKKFLYGWMPPHQSFYVKKHFFEKFGSYRLGYKISADYELLLRFLYKEGISSKYISETLIYMRNGGVSSSIKNKILLNRECKKAWLDNDLKPRFYSVLLKPIRNIPQLFLRPKNT